MNLATPDTRALVEGLSQAVWFARVGTPLDPQYKQAESWEEAIAACGTTLWDDVLLEMRNQLSESLDTADRTRFQSWNQIASQGKALLKPLVRERIEGLAPVVPALKSKEVLGAIDWILLSAYMECEFAEVVKPGFFLNLAQLFVGGRFPCGWDGVPFPEGSVPDGRLIVY